MKHAPIQEKIHYLNCLCFEFFYFKNRGDTFISYVNVNEPEQRPRII